MDPFHLYNSHSPTRIYRAVTGFLLAFICQFGMADSASEAQHASAQSHSSESSEHSSHSYHPNLLGLFVGVADEKDHGNEMAVGLEYTRRFNEHFSIGAIAEYTGGDADFWVAAIPFGWHLGQWKLYVAPGIEDGDHGTEDLVRLGVEYAFELSGGWELAPQVNVDFVDDHEVWVFGVLFAKGF